jgi:hypothetical protein
MVLIRIVATLSMALIRTVMPFLMPVIIKIVISSGHDKSHNFSLTIMKRMNIARLSKTVVRMESCFFIHDFKAGGQSSFLGNKSPLN